MAEFSRDELGILSDEKLEDMYMNIVALVTGSGSIDDFDGQLYTSLPELFSEYLVEQNEYRCKLLIKQLSKIADKILEFQKSIDLNQQKKKFLEKEKSRG